MAETRPKLEFATNIPKEVTLGKNFKNGTGDYGNWYGWNVFEEGQEKVLFAKDALHEKIKDYGEGSKLTITYAERKGADGKPFHEWQVSNGDSPEQIADRVAEKVTKRIDLIYGEVLEAHLLACADLANKVTEKLGITDDQARQATFATVVIDTGRRNVILGDSSPSGPSEPQEDSGQRDALLKGVKSACKLLNDEGYEPRFTPKMLKGFVLEEFNCEIGELGIEQLEQLLKTLSDKLDDFRINRTIDSEPVDQELEEIPF